MMVKKNIAKKPEKALLIIDMQKGSFGPQTPRFDSDGIIKRINELADTFRQQNSRVIFIQHDGTGTGEFEKGTEEWGLLNELNVQPGDLMIDKYANDVFYKSNLIPSLIELGINELFISGCATDFCIESTVQSALIKDLNVTVVSDAHTTGNREHLSAEKIIEHYNWVWQNMLPTEGTIKVKTTALIKQECIL